jgi:glutathione synthase/RimK-type ligase-like ATP-grasp enzyme
MAATIGFRVPATKVTNEPYAAETWYRAIDGSAIYKPQRYGRIVRGDTVSVIYTNVIEPHHATKFASVQYAPVLLQPYISKGYEVRATVVGQYVFAAALASQTVPGAQHDWRRVDASVLPHTPHRLPSVVEAQCIALVRALGLNFGAIDLIVTPSGDYIFLEINPNGQWAWIQQMCPELQIREALIDLLQGKGSNHAAASTAHEPA